MRSTTISISASLMNPCDLVVAHALRPNKLIESGLDAIEHAAAKLRCQRDGNGVKLAAVVHLEEARVVTESIADICDPDAVVVMRPACPQWRSGRIGFLGEEARAGELVGCLARNRGK